MAKEFVLGVGESHKVSTLLIFKSTKFMYCGMPGKDVFSIGLLEEAGYRSRALNLYFPVNSDKINVEGKTFRVINATPEKITLRQI
ncbi:MAG: hypothetical protein ABH834_00310 [Candidatus Altiarchaeota archaeon]